MTIMAMLLEQILHIGTVQDTLKAGQKSSFDLLSSKDNFNDMKNYELSLQWRNPGGTDEDVGNAQGTERQKINSIENF